MINNILAALLPQSAGSTKEEKEKGKKGKKGKGKEEPFRKPAAQKQQQKTRNVETAVKKAEQRGGGGEEGEEKRPPGEEGGAAEQEDKVKGCEVSELHFHLLILRDTSKENSQMLLHLFTLCKENENNLFKCVK